MLATTSVYFVHLSVPLPVISGISTTLDGAFIKLVEQLQIKNDHTRKLTV